MEIRHSPAPHRDGYRRHQPAENTAQDVSVARAKPVFEERTDLAADQPADHDADDPADETEHGSGEEVSGITGHDRGRETDRDESADRPDDRADERAQVRFTESRPGGFGFRGVQRSIPYRVSVLVVPEVGDCNRFVFTSGIVASDRHGISFLSIVSTRGMSWISWP